MPIKNFFLLLLLLLIVRPAYAEKYHGRFTIGSFIAKETFKESTAGIFSNDFNIVSSGNNTNQLEMNIVAKTYRYRDGLADEL